jgi:hypothetical protein
MAFNPSPKVAEARSIGQKYGKSKVIIVMIDDQAGTMESASYGATSLLCKEAQALADIAYDAINRHLEEKAG